ncbi:multimeric flavodoxin WrbA [Sphingomonas zeicaulis]|uniref:flavodoxin family protein n=1 Tax=Sphingomonas zeicaulis TaxID=1632740 RepID=UPI003D1CFBBE
MRRTLLIVHHSATGGTRQMAEAAAEGARRVDGVGVLSRHAAEAGADDLLGADLYLFATPEMLAAMAGVMKGFFDRSYYPVLGRIEGRPYAAMVCAGSDGGNAVRQVERIATGWRLKRVAEPLIVCTHAQTPEAILAQKHIAPKDLDRCRETGEMLATGLSLGIF